MELSLDVLFSVSAWNQIDECNFTETKPQIMYFLPLYIAFYLKRPEKMKVEAKDEENMMRNWVLTVFHYISPLLGLICPLPAIFLMTCYFWINRNGDVWSSVILRACWKKISQDIFLFLFFFFIKRRSVSESHFQCWGFLLVLFAKQKFFLFK